MKITSIAVLIAAFAGSLTYAVPAAGLSIVGTQIVTLDTRQYSFFITVSNTVPSGNDGCSAGNTVWLVVDPSAFSSTSLYRDVVSTAQLAYAQGKTVNITTSGCYTFPGGSTSFPKILYLDPQ